MHSRAVLAGDHLQLPPTITSETAAKDGLNYTLLERVVESYGDNAVRMLDTQVGWLPEGLARCML